MSVARGYRGMMSRAGYPRSDVHDAFDVAYRSLCGQIDYQTDTCENITFPQLPWQAGKCNTYLDFKQKMKPKEKLKLVPVWY